jgi:type IV secretion system protein VirB10
VPSNTASTALQGTIAIKPVLTKNQGEEVGIFVAQDFNFSAVYNLVPRP